MRFAFSGARVARRLACVACVPLVAFAQQTAKQAVIADAHTRLPLAGVVLDGAGLLIRTDASGRLTIPATPDRAALTLRRTGYRPLALGAAMPSDTILLVPEPTLLSTVTVESRAAGNMLATGTTQPVSSVSRAQLDAAAAPSLADALKGIEGISVQRPGAWGSKAFVRGLGGERVAVLIDGQRVNRACTFGMDQGLATVDPATVERVEMLSGPGSTLYGSGNVGGVINVVTRRAATAGRRGGEVRAATSSAVPGASAGATFSAAGQRSDVVFSADAASFGDYRAPTGTVNESGLRTLSLDAKASLQPTAPTRLSVQGAAYEGRDIGYPGSMGATIPRESRYSGAVEWGAQLSRGALDAVSTRVFAQRLEHDMSVQMAMMMNAMKVTQVTDARSHSLTSGARTQLRLVPSATLRLDAGAEAVQWRAEATRVTQRVSTPAPAPTVLHTWPDVRVLDAGIFAQGEWQAAARLSITGGLRADYIDKHATGWATDDQWISTGNAGAILRLGNSVRARANFGVGYRVPDPTESFGLALRPDGYVYQGTPSLRTEMAHNTEFGLMYDRSVGGHLLSSSMSVFDNRLSDLIAPVLVPGETVGGRPVRAYANVARAELTGVTGSASVTTSSGQRLSVAAQRLRGTNRVDETPLAQVPPAEAMLTLHFTQRRYAARPWLEAGWRVVAGQDRVAASASELRTPGFGTLDLRAGGMLAGVRLTAGVENVLNRAFREHVDPGTILRPGRNVFARMTRTF